MAAIGRAILLSVGLAFFAGCATTAPLPPLDLNAPGWTVRQGQAVWQTEQGAPEIAGDVILSTHPAAGAFVAFSKTLPIVTGRISPEGWQFESPPGGKRYSGRGQPPKRIVWLQLLRALEGREISDRWTVAHPSDLYIALENEHTGERLQVQLQK